MLTPRQEKFAKQYLLTGNGSEAARLAGYSQKTAGQMGYENLKKPEVIDAIRELQAGYAAQLQVTKDDLIAGLFSAIEMGRQQQKPAAIIAGFVQIAKLCGFYEPEKVNLTLNAGGKRLSAKFAAMSDDELLAIIAGG